MTEKNETNQINITVFKLCYISTIPNNINNKQISLDLENRSPKIVPESRSKASTLAITASGGVSSRTVMLVVD